MANWTRRQLAKTALAFVSTSLLLLDLKLKGVNAQSCNYYYYDYEYGCNSQMYASGECGGGGGSCYFGWTPGTGQSC